jgi:hypothetical protein
VEWSSIFLSFCLRYISEENFIMVCYCCPLMFEHLFGDHMSIITREQLSAGRPRSEDPKRDDRRIER